MKTIWLLAAGLAGGVLGGMGFGGGMLLIPILTLLLGVPYSLAAWVNLVVFLPTAIVALIKHSGNRMIEWRIVLQSLLFGFVGFFFGAMLSGRLSDDVTRRIFGIFLIAIGTLSIIFVLVGYFKENRRN